MAKSVYYYQLGAGTKADPYREVKESIKTIYHRHKGRYGYRRVQEEPGHQNCYLNPKTVQKLMGRLHLKPTVRPKRYKSYRGSVGTAAPNLLERNFTAKAPNQKWVTDVTEFNVLGHKVYLSPVLDLYNQEVISYEIADRPPNEHGDANASKIF
jgi:putative transposase